MSKELEIMKKEREWLVEQGYADCYIEECDLVIKALQRLEAIDNSNPNEALKCLEEWKYQINSYIDCSLECGDIDNECYNHLIEELEQDYTIIEQALLKAQEPKHYLKWEDLEFKELEFKVEQKKDFKVKLNDTEYGLEICITFGIKEALIFDEKKVLYAVFHERHKQFFNDLHLERVEE